MRIRLFSCLVALMLPLAASAGGPDIIPVPVSCRPADGVCVWRGTAKLRIGGRRFGKTVGNLPEFAKEEAYRISISPRKVLIEALTPTGAFRARTTLEQMLSRSDTLPCCTILDHPRFRHRGLMIDESRSFKGADFLKKQMDAMAALKLNVLHIHLTDSAGWRIEVPGYPVLTDSAAWRIGKSYFDWEAAGYPFSGKGNPDAYGGYYTAAELRELVAYAAERHITIIPEIEMPGHSMEVNRMLPELNCVDSSGHRHNFVWDLCPGNENTFAFLKAALDQVMSIFPSEFIHIGGDEATMKEWGYCVNCRKRMEGEGFTDVHELQGYMVRRVSEYLKAHGRRAIGWDEILGTGIPQEAVVMSWRGTEGGIIGSAAGHDVILSPNSHCYFDYYQDLIRKEPPACGPLVSLRFCYGYEPLTTGMDASHILGIQANLWCEYIPTPEHAEYMLYPRLFAIAETAWSPAEKKEFHDFRRRCLLLLDDFHSRGYNSFDLETESELARSGFQRFEHLEQYKQQQKQ